MKDICKVIAHSLFQNLIILSVFLIPCFYWPNHEPRLMKFICFQTFMTILLCMSFLFVPKRRINNFYPAIFLLVAFVNLFTHGMNDYVNVGVSFIFPTILGIYVISNHLHGNYVSTIKKAIVLLCLLNCVLFITQLMGMSLIFDYDKHIGWQRPSGFMCYPASFALLCGVSIILAWHWQKWMILPIGICLWLSHEYSVFLGVFLSLSLPLLRGYWKFIPLIILAGIVFLLWHRSFTDISSIESKIALRMKYIYPVFQNVWARPLDGWGVGMYNRLPDSFFGFPRGNWSEMHCEPLDLLFCMGLMGVSCIAGWIRYVVKNMTVQSKRIFIIFGTMACFHSPFHFADTLFLFVILTSLAEIEIYESTT